jgi:hypothetical protein
MSAEFDDVLTNQPIVIDNVRSITRALSNPGHVRELTLTIVPLFFFSLFRFDRDLER